MNGMFDEIKKLKEIFDGKFLITHDVKREIIDRPINIKKFEFEALQLQKLVDEKVLEMPDSLGVSANEVDKETKKLMDIANNIFEANKNKIHILDSGEVSCFALSILLNQKKIKNTLAIDERTARMISERPDNLKDLLQKKLHAKIRVEKNNYHYFEGFKIIRSSELVYIAYKKGLVDLEGSMVLDALLYAVKFKGCSISDEEIKEIKGIS
jgi:hypothetical protein